MFQSVRNEVELNKGAIYIEFWPQNWSACFGHNQHPIMTYIDNVII